MEKTCIWRFRSPNLRKKSGIAKMWKNFLILKYKMLTGLKDVDREVLKYVDDKQLLKICSIDKKTWNEVCDDWFLRRRLSKYPDIEKYKKEKESWKRFFLRAIYYIAKMKEKYQYDYISGDFKEQYY
jgi:hypothetical protein